jgi:3-methyladenine DNA glycosylase Mpg
MARIWTLEQKAKQAALIRSWKPWQKSTGPRTEAGKAIASKNVLLGNENRAKALAIARRELAEAQAKIRKLSRGKAGFA